jgi:hypothetical protein
VCQAGPGSRPALGCEVVERGHPAVATRHVRNPHKVFFRIKRERDTSEQLKALFEKGGIIFGAGKIYIAENKLKRKRKQKDIAVATRPSFNVFL